MLTRLLGIKMFSIFDATTEHKQDVRTVQDVSKMNTTEDASKLIYKH